jgi:hypothetical protein
VEEAAVPAIACSASFIVMYNKERRSQPRCWLQKFLKESKAHGEYNSVLRELHIEDRRGFKNVICMTPTDFEEFANCGISNYFSEEHFVLTGFSCK